MADQLGKDRVLLKGIGLNFGEAAMLCDALRALWLSPKFIERVWTEMRATIRADGLEDKWSTKADPMLKRLAQLRRAESTAVLRAAIRFWERHEEPTAKLLAELMLLQPPGKNRAEPSRKTRQASPRTKPLTSKSKSTNSKPRGKGKPPRSR
ncbi:MAG: hypothetical protein ACREQ4_10115 [Candidatus Binataceae bacterium]